MVAKRLLPRRPRGERSARWRVPVAASIGAHAALIAFAWTAWQAGQHAAPAATSVVIRMIEWVAPVRPEARPEPVQPVEPNRRSARRGAAGTPADEDRPAPSAGAAEPAVPVVPDASSGEVPAASPGLDQESIQRAARQAARSRSLVQQSNDLIGTKPPPTAQEQLGRQVARSAKGDCLKGGEGGYDKQGLGLLAIPFLIVDAATGNCRK